MKKLLNILSVSVMLVAFACNDDDDYGPAVYEYAAIDASNVVDEANEDSEDGVSIPVTYGGRISNPSSFTVSYTITGGTYGTDYTVTGGTGSSGSITIPAGSDPVGTLQILGVPDNVEEDAVSLNVTFSTTSNGLIVGYPGTNEIEVTLADDDCAYVEAEYITTAAATEYYDDGSVYPDDGSTYDVVFELTGENEFTMDNYWDSGLSVTFTIDPTTLLVTVPLQSLGGANTVQGTGKLSTCGKLLTIQTVLKYGANTYDFENTYQFPIE